MKRFKRITIIGVGLIGGSIGLAAKNRRLAEEVVGVFRHRSTLNRALRHKAVDKGFMTIEEGVRDADLIILATPVHSIPVLVREAVNFAKKGAIITDAGSTKGWIVAKCENALGRHSQVSFVGSHPMAGSEHTGVEFAKADLFEGSLCIVTRTVSTDKRALGVVSGFWRSLGAKVKIMSPSEHDRTVALVSHLPHVVAFSLAGAVPGREMECSAEGFRDTTRIASSDPELWADIFLTNKKALLEAARMFESYYGKVIKAIAGGQYLATVKMLGKAKAKRDKFLYGKRR
ncbi:MAG: prephenate dehydrogenase/arogenate dehydrogenase family protein [Candidatus Omnitrophica bacterium]|nr:prephenate dehydrogenase/arogenate dehydrogenase family protein [Candidatus Omnitrophota bacterium]